MSQPVTPVAFTPQKRVLIEAQVLNVAKSNKYTSKFSIITNVSRKHFECIANFHIPLREGDQISGQGVLEEGKVKLIEIPMVQPDDSKEGFMRMFNKSVRGITPTIAGRMYDWLKREVEKIKETDGINSIHSYLDSIAYKKFREGDSDCYAIFKNVFHSVNIDEFIKWWYFHNSLRRLYLLGLTKQDIKRINIDYNKAYTILLENPLLLVNLPIETCMTILRTTRRTLTPRQIRCGEIARYIYNRIIEYNWTCYPTNLLYSEVVDIKEYLEELTLPLFPTENKPRGYGCVIDFDCFYLYDNYVIEKGIAEMIVEMNKPFGEIREVIIADSELKPSEEQIQAIKMALNNGVSLITGEAGSGKSTTVKWLMDNLKYYDEEHVVVSFTGKAVARIKDITKTENAYTIHKLIMKPLVATTRTVVPDETSMIETPLMHRFLNVNKNVKHLIFLGDPNQLLPIGWGCLFMEMLKSNKIPRIHLKQQHRQQIGKEDNMLYHNLQSVLKRELMLCGMGFEMIDGDLIDVINKAIDYKEKCEDFCVLSPVNKDVVDINYKLRDIANPNGEKYIEPYGKEWRNGDKVMMTENCYEINIMNGEQGIIVDGDDYSITVNFRLGKFKIPFNISKENKDEIEDPDEEKVILNTKLLTLAYCITVHRSQGSEWEAGIFYVPPYLNASGFYCNNLVYTALSRFKKQVSVIGNVNSFQEAIYKEPTIRYDNLNKRL